jgi:hypothetical protein
MFFIIKWLCVLTEEVRRTKKELHGAVSNLQVAKHENSQTKQWPFGSRGSTGPKNTSKILLEKLLVSQITNISKHVMKPEI